MGVLTHDRTIIAEAVSTFSDGYLKSGWGRYKSLTKPTFIQAMIAYAKFYLTYPVDSELILLLFPVTGLNCGRSLSAILRNFNAIHINFLVR